MSHFSFCNPAFSTNLYVKASYKCQFLIKSDIIIAAGEELSKIDFNDVNSLLPDDELGVGHKILLYLSEEEDYFDSSMKVIFLIMESKNFSYITIVILSSLMMNLWMM